MPREQQRARPEAVQQLWAEYRATQDRRIRDRLVLTLAPMVKYIVYRKIREIPQRCQVEDFISCGLEALIKSIERYDPERGASLEQFAWTRVHGAVIDEMRRNDWAPRSLRRWERDIAKASERFSALYGRPPSRQELADALALTVQELDRHQADIARSDVGSLNTLILGEDGSAIERVDAVASSDEACEPEQVAMRRRASERFREAFGRLPQRDRQVAVLLYVERLNLREVGEVLGVSESRVCQMHGQLKRRLREQLVAHEQLLAEVS